MLNKWNSPMKVTDAGSAGGKLIDQSFKQDFLSNYTFVSLYYTCGVW